MGKKYKANTVSDFDELRSLITSSSSTQKVAAVNPPKPEALKPDNGYLSDVSKRLLSFRPTPQPTEQPKVQARCTILEEIPVLEFEVGTVLGFERDGMMSSCGCADVETLVEAFKQVLDDSLSQHFSSFEVPRAEVSVSQVTTRQAVSHLDHLHDQLEQFWADFEFAGKSYFKKTGRESHRMTVAVYEDREEMHSYYDYLIKSGDQAYPNMRVVVKTPEDAKNLINAIRTSAREKDFRCGTHYLHNTIDMSW